MKIVAKCLAFVILKYQVHVKGFNLIPLMVNAIKINTTSSAELKLSLPLKLVNS